MKLKDINTLEVILEKANICLYVQDNPITESMNVGFGQKKGGIIAKGLQGIGKFANTHPWITATMAMYALDASKTYKKNKRKTITFYSKDSQERKMYRDIVDTLMSTGKYKKVKNTALDGGWLWELKKL